MAIKQISGLLSAACVLSRSSAFFRIRCRRFELSATSATVFSGPVRETSLRGVKPVTSVYCLKRESERGKSSSMLWGTAGRVSLLSIAKQLPLLYSYVLTGYKSALGEEYQLEEKQKGMRGGTRR